MDVMYPVWNSIDSGTQEKLLTSFEENLILPAMEFQEKPQIEFSSISNFFASTSKRWHFSEKNWLAEQNARVQFQDGKNALLKTKKFSKAVKCFAKAAKGGEVQARVAYAASRVLWSEKVDRDQIISSLYQLYSVSKTCTDEKVQFFVQLAMEQIKNVKVEKKSVLQSLQDRPQTVLDLVIYQKCFSKEERPSLSEETIVKILEKNYLSQKDWQLLKGVWGVKKCSSFKEKASRNPREHSPKVLCNLALESLYRGNRMGGMYLLKFAAPLDVKKNSERKSDAYAHYLLAEEAMGNSLFGVRGRSTKVVNLAEHDRHMKKAALGGFSLAYEPYGNTLFRTGETIKKQWAIQYYREAQKSGLSLSRKNQKRLEEYKDVKIDFDVEDDLY